MLPRFPIIIDALRFTAGGVLIAFCKLLVGLVNLVSVPVRGNSVVDCDLGQLAIRTRDSITQCEQLVAGN